MAEKEEIILLEQEKIEGIRKIVQFKNLIDDEYFDNLKKKRIEATKSFILLADLLVDSYEILEGVSLKLKNEEKDYSEDIRKFLSQFSSIVYAVRSLLNEFTHGASIGDYFLKIRIDRIIQDNKESCSKLINTFFSIFGDDL